MGIFDRFGRGAPKEEASSSAAAPEVLLESHAASSTQSEVLRESSSAPASLPAGSIDLSSREPGSRLYNPYEGLRTGDGRAPAFKLPRQPEFLFSEEASVHKRTWSENLTFYTGTGYLSGTKYTCFPSLLPAHKALVFCLFKEDQFQWSRNSHLDASERQCKFFAFACDQHNPRITPQMNLTLWGSFRGNSGRWERSDRRCPDQPRSRVWEQADTCEHSAQQIWEFGAKRWQCSGGAGPILFHL